MRTRYRFPFRLSLAAPLLPLLLFVSSCGGRGGNGSFSIFGILYIALAIAAVVSLLKQDWDLTKKLIWGAVIWFFPFGGSIVYFLFSGRR